MKKALYLLFFLLITGISNAQSPDQSVTDESGYYQIFGTPDGFIMDSAGQSFMCGMTGTLAKIDLYLYFSAGCDDPMAAQFNLTIRIFEGNGMSGNVIATENIPLQSPFGGVQTVVFSTPPLLTSGLQYTISLSGICMCFLSGGPAFYTASWSNVISDYPPGSNYFNGTAGSGDNAFTTYMNVACSVPTISSTTPGSRCGTGTVSLEAAASNGTIKWYAASTGGTALDTGTTFITPSISNTTSYWVGATDDTCVSSRTEVVATVNPNVPASVSISSDDGDNIICSGDSINFTATPTGGGSFPSYQWKVNGVNAGTDTAFFSSNTLNNSDTVKVVMTSNETCASGSPATSSGIIMTVLANSTGTFTHSLCNAYTWINSVTYTSSNNTATHVLTNAAGCDSTVTLNFTRLYSSSGTDVQNVCGPLTWINGVTYTTDEFWATHTLVNATGCDSIVTLNYTRLHYNHVSQNGATFTATYAGADSYQWINCSTNQPIAGSTGQTYTATANGNIAVIVTKNGCADTSACMAVSVFSSWTEKGTPWTVNTGSVLGGHSVCLDSASNNFASGGPGTSGSFKGLTILAGWDGTEWGAYTSASYVWGDNGTTGGSGYSVGLSADGHTAVIGANMYSGGGIFRGMVRVYKWNATNWAWEQKGVDINGEANYDKFGSSVSISADGNTIAAGAPLNGGNGASSGRVRVYDWSGSAWVQRGTGIDGEAANDSSGIALSLSSDGGQVLIGAPGNDGNGTSAGHARLYLWTGSSWDLWAELNGEAAGDNFGSSVAISKWGLKLVVGAPGNDGAGTDAGHVRIYYQNYSGYVFDEINGELAGDNSGCSVSVNDDGSTIAVGAKNNDGGDANAGHARVYRFNGSLWIQRGADINGAQANSQSGFSVDLSYDGNTVIVGSPFYDNGTATDAGIATVYSFNNNFDISGIITYDNSLSTPMNNVKAYLYQNSILSDSTVTGASGDYLFSSKPNGSYTLTATTIKAWGDGNATDALVVQNHFAGNITLTEPRLAAADVNASSSVNTTDALFIQNRFLGTITSYPSGDWYFNPQTVTVSNANTTMDFKGICFGDANGSFTPSSAKTGCFVSILSNGTINLTAGSPVEIPVTVESAMQVGAISLVLSYPQDMIEVLSVNPVAPGLANLFSNIVGGQVRIAWSSLQTLSVNPNDILFTVTVQALPNATGEVSFQIGGESEFADASANIITSVPLSIPTMELGATNIDATNATSISVNVYPNPLSANSVIFYTLPETGNITISLYDMTGRNVANIVSHNQSAGSHSVLINSAGLSEGIYQCLFTLESSSGVITERKTISVIK